MNSKEYSKGCTDAFNSFLASRTPRQVALHEREAELNREYGKCYDPIEALKIRAEYFQVVNSLQVELTCGSLYLSDKSEPVDNSEEEEE